MLKTIPLSDNTVKRRIDDCAEDIEEQLVEKLKKSPLYALLLDESTDFESKAQLIVIEEDLFFCLPIESNANAANNFGIIDLYLLTNGLLWSNCEVCTDGAPVMIRAKSGFKVLVLKSNPKVTFMHCIIHRGSLASGFAEDSPFQTDLAVVVKMVNEIKAHPLQTRLFKLLCKEMGASYTSLLFYSKQNGGGEGPWTRTEKLQHAQNTAAQGWRVSGPWSHGSSQHRSDQQQTCREELAEAVALRAPALPTCPSVALLGQRQDAVVDESRWKPCSNPLRTPSTPSSRKHKFSEEFVSFGFTYDILDGQERPRCVVCNDVLANESLKPVKLRRHLETKHPKLVDKPVAAARNARRLRNDSQSRKRR
ncbi:hypothetical protein FOCC_FOCC014913 [Frankliniella occidentalis]|nr:hypothetical protein FOCC_FOCC014913 [Frankliniella occidentalis]